jgi:Zn-dependent protease
VRPRDHVDLLHTDPVRSFVAGLAVLLAFLTGTAALGGAVVHRTLLDPAKAGQVVEKALQDPELRNEILAEAVPRFGTFPQIVQTQVGALAQTSTVRSAVRRLRLDSDGTVSLQPLQAALAQQLRQAGLAPVAAVVTSQDARVAVPSRYLTRYHDARRTTQRLEQWGGLATAVLVVLALLVSPRRLRTVRSIGVATLLACAAVAALFWALPGLLRASSSDVAYDALAAAVQGQRSAMGAMVVPVAVVGLVLVVVGLVGSRRRS